MKLFLKFIFISLTFLRSVNSFLLDFTNTSNMNIKVHTFILEKVEIVSEKMNVVIKNRNQFDSLTLSSGKIHSIPFLPRYSFFIVIEFLSEVADNEPLNFENKQCFLIIKKKDANFSFVNEERKHSLIQWEIEGNNKEEVRMEIKNARSSNPLTHFIWPVFDVKRTNKEDTESLYVIDGGLE